jgi:hypothetical protein
LRKSLPDLQTIETTLRGDADHPLMISSADGQL